MLLDRPTQLRLPMARDKAARNESEQSTPSTDNQKVERVQIDQLLSTEDIVRITGRHRCTIYRWIRRGRFPLKRGGGGKGWLRSDVERWLTSGR